MKRAVVLATGAATVVAGAIALTAPASSAAVTPQANLAAMKARAATAADRLIAGQPARFHVSSGDQLLRQTVTDNTGLVYVSFTRSYHDMPVVGGDFVVVTDANGTVLDTQVAQSSTLSAGTTAKITAAAAAKTARQQMAKAEGVSAPVLSMIATGAGQLAYEVVVTGAKKAQLGGYLPSKLHVYVDALTGKVIKAKTWDEVQDGHGKGFYYKDVQLATSGSGGSFTMKDPTKTGVQCGGQNGTAYTKSTDEWGNNSGTDLESACVDALYSLSKEWDMLKEWTGRNGVDGNGSGFKALVGLNQVNAFWDGSKTSFGHTQDNKRQLTNFDVVGHENGHAIIQFTPGGSSVESGQNESAGDIFGALTEFYANDPGDKPDYEVGEMPDLVGKGPIRYMYDPSKNAGDPNCYSSKIPSTEVHAAAGPQNHWFYLVSEGSNPTNGQPKSPTCNGKAVTGITIQKAGKIWMNALMRKTSGWTHAKARTATIAAAKEIYPGGTECAAVAAAWDAVSVPGTTC